MTTFEERCQEQRDDEDFVAEFEHQDGSRTFILRDPDPRHADPRDGDNVSTLVREGNDYEALDDDDAGLREARDRWHWLGTYGYSSRGQYAPRNPTEVDKALFKYDREKMMQRYVAMFRPEILHYEDNWQVSGFTQGHWSYGYGYVTQGSWDALMGEGYDGDITPKEAFEQDVKVYELYFAGDVYGHVSIQPGDPVITTDVDGEHAECRYCESPISPYDHGDGKTLTWIDDCSGESECDQAPAGTDGDHAPVRVVAKETDCWGHLGYDSFEDIIRDQSELDSPLVGEV